MARYSRLTVLTTMIEPGLVPLFYHGDVEVATRIVEACLDGGAHCMEFTNRDDRAIRVFEQLVRRFEDDARLVLGVGSVVDLGTATLYIQLGTNFVVGPTLNAEVARVCNRRKVAYIPGCGTVTEISQAEELGVEICKFFPGRHIGGPAFIKSIRGPMPQTRIMPTGGVMPTKENIRDWFEVGVAAVGIGSRLITKEAIASGDCATITKGVRQVLAWIQDIRGDAPIPD